MRAFLHCTLYAIFLGGVAMAAEPPRFVVPGHDREMTALNELHALHSKRGFTDCTLWDAWLPHATLWTGPQPRQKYRQAFLTRRIDTEGYVSMQQHRGMAHSEGWPFPAWQQSTGKGWHFSVLHEAWAIQAFKLNALTSAAGWEITGARVEGIDPATGLKLEATGPVVTITTPAFHVGTIAAPFARLEWSAMGLSPKSRPRIAWLLEGESKWQPDRAAPFPALTGRVGMQFANVPLHRQPGYAGVVTRYRITIDRATGASITLKSLITVIDTRHPITNALFLKGSSEQFLWTRDVKFLAANISRMRNALRYALEEFQVREGKHVLVPWVGHDGRSGLTVDAGGKKTLRYGLGVGNNYWDLLPFGGHDALATIYLYDAIRHFAAVERAIAAHPEWSMVTDPPAFTCRDLTALLAAMKADFGKRFWNADRGRFVGWIDREGRAYDYGFTFVNIEAVHYGLATEEQARRIYDWLDGKREVAGDTSRGADIYHWRFGPRATTRRNVETYVWAWSAPESIPWGNQVQDGGAVMGFSYFDLMARLKILGPNDARRRLREILAWFSEVQAEGGYRKYYAKPGRGTLQGGGTPGGLGLDHEFMESVLVPQVMLYGFLGFQPTAEGFSMSPKLPDDWPSLTISGVHIHDHVLDITADRSGKVRLKVREPDSRQLQVRIGDRNIALPIRPAGSVIELAP